MNEPLLKLADPDVDDMYEMDAAEDHGVWMRIGGLDVNVHTHPIRGVTVDICVYDARSGGFEMGQLLDHAHAKQPR